MRAVGMNIGAILGKGGVTAKFGARRGAMAAVGPIMVVSLRECC